MYDAVVIGSGPNGLAAAITLARAGLAVLVVEASETIGGGTRTMELTLPGFLHDVCSAVHPFGVASPFFRDLPLEAQGLEWVFPQAPLAQTFADGMASLVWRSLERTAEGFGLDREAYLGLFQPWLNSWQPLLAETLGPFPLLPRRPLLLARFGWLAVRSASRLARATFQTERARTVFTGIAAHAMLPLDKPLTASFGLMLGLLAHAVGWPVARGGSQSISQAMGKVLVGLGGELRTNFPIAQWEDIPATRSIFFDLTPRQIMAIAGDRFPSGYRRKLMRYRYGMGVFKMDWAMNEPIPWSSADLHLAGTIHIGGGLEEIEASERAVGKGYVTEKPFVLLNQPSLIDPSRAPNGKHIAWAYCHVPNGSDVDMTEQIEAQIERFAPGFRDCILARHTISPLEMEAYNPNYVGGDINGGVQDLRQFFARPVASLNPYETPLDDVYICSSATPTGGGVHGMCGYRAAQAMLKRYGKSLPKA